MQAQHASFCSVTRRGERHVIVFFSYLGDVVVERFPGRQAFLYAIEEGIFLGRGRYRMIMVLLHGC